MKNALRIFGIVTLTLLSLCIEIKEKPIFDHIYGIIAPATRGAQRATENFFAFAFQSTQDYSKKLFVNSEPKFRDSVKRKMAAPTRTQVTEPEEKVPLEDQEQLDELIKSHL